MRTVLVTAQVREETKEEFNQLKDLNFLFKPFEDTTEEERKIIDTVFGMVTEEMVEKLPKLDYVQLPSAGANTFSWLPEHITLSNAYGGYAKGISEYLIACTMMIQKILPTYLFQQKEHLWKKHQTVKSIENAKILCVGMGSIGTAYLEKAHALGAKCYGIRRTIKDKPSFVEEVYTTESLDELLPQCDVVALCLPETTETINLFNLERLRKMKKDAILLNIGRGSAIVTEDLIQVLNEGHLFGVVLDVTEPEPLPQNHPLWNTPRVYITPHISGGYTTDANYDNVIAVVKENLLRLIEGRESLHTVNRKLGY